MPSPQHERFGKLRKVVSCHGYPVGGKVNTDGYRAIIPINVKCGLSGVRYLDKLDTVTRIAQRQTVHGCHHIAGQKPKASNARAVPPGAMR